MDMRIVVVMVMVVSRGHSGFRVEALGLGALESGVHNKLKLRYEEARIYLNKHATRSSSAGLYIHFYVLDDLFDSLQEFEVKGFQQGLGCRFRAKRIVSSSNSSSTSTSTSTNTSTSTTSRPPPRHYFLLKSKYKFPGEAANSSSTGNAGNAART